MGAFSTLDEFRARSIARLELPSGLSVLVRRVSPLDYVAIAGVLPSSLLQRIREAGDPTPDTRHLTPALAGEEIARNGEVICELLRRTIIEPAGLDPHWLSAADLEVVRRYALGETEGTEAEEAEEAQEAEEAKETKEAKETRRLPSSASSASSASCASSASSASSRFDRFPGRAGPAVAGANGGAVEGEAE